MQNQIATFLMFEGRAEEAMNFYVSLFDNAEIKSITRYSEDATDGAGKVMHAAFTVKGHEFMCTDSTIKHNFTFTPAISLFISCTSEQEIERLYNELSEGGKVLMELGAYGFSQKYGWVEDRFGVSWQLNLT